MDPYQTQQPDEGYSEDPLSASGSLTLTAAAKASSGDADAGLPLAISEHIKTLSVEAKIGTRHTVHSLFGKLTVSESFCLLMIP